MKLFEKEFFMQKTEAATIRSFCLIALNSSEDVLYTQGRDVISLADLLEARALLAELGVKPGMHARRSGESYDEKKRQRLECDPIFAAQWLAGQVLTGCKPSELMDTPGMTVIEEHSALHEEAGPYPSIDLMAIGPKSINFLWRLSLIGMIKGYFDSEEKTVATNKISLN